MTEQMRSIVQFVRTPLGALGVFVLVLVILLLAGWIGPSADVRFEREVVEPADVPLAEVVQFGQERWTMLRAEGTDIAHGPCLDDGERFPGWAIDLVRGERVDNLPENQCPSFLAGRSPRLVELSLEGNVVRVIPESLSR